jgi:pimeloyl-ACP methyl ester carboxylesterase
MLVVHDRDDDLIGADQAHRIARAHEGKADLLITEGLGHRRVLADPAVVAAVLDFASATDPVG